MVEVKHRQVGLTTIDARVCEQVVPDSLLKFTVALLAIALDPRHLEDAVLGPPFTVV